jgi:hypothetical protein
MTHMTQLRSLLRKGGAAALVVGIAAALPVLFATAASAQTTDCPAGGRGGAAGNAGRSVAGAGGLAFTVGPFATGATAGNATAAGGSGGSASGGDGGRGGSGTLPICNQNTNNVGTEAPAYAGGPGGGSGPSGGGGNVLARTGSRTMIELSLAGLVLAAGGVLLFFGQPRWGADRV